MKAPAIGLASVGMVGGKPRCYYWICVDGKTYRQNHKEGGRWDEWVGGKSFRDWRQCRNAETTAKLDGLLRDYLAPELEPITTATDSQKYAAVMNATGLRECRRLCKLSQGQLGKISGYAQTSIASWEIGRRGVTLAAARDIVEALNTYAKAKKIINIDDNFTLDRVFPPC